MRILYDGTIYNSQKIGGINRYFDNIINRLPDNFQPIVTSLRSPKDLLLSHSNLKVSYYKRFGFRPGRVSYWLEPYYFQAVEAIKNPQIFHPTYYSLLTRQKINKRRCPIVITVYDMIHEIFAERVEANGKTIDLKRTAILAADLILCISKNTKKDLLERYSLPEERIWVTYLASEFDTTLGYGNEAIPDAPFFLYVGGRGDYKNFQCLLAAFAKVSAKFPDLILCVVGSPWTQTEQSKIRERNLDKHIQQIIFASDSHLAKLYRHCIAFVYPSLYEGFGIPLLEAMNCQAPVIAANSSSIPEVVGDAALLFNPTSVTDLADSLLFLLEHPAERERLIAKGLQQAQKFSWDDTVAQTIQAYQYVLG